jgi:hypothetical protein
MLNAWRKDISRAKTAYQQGAGLVGTMFNFFCGRSTFFALVFTAVGIYLALRGKLTMEYSAFATAMQGFIVGHSWKEDAYAPTQQSTTVNVTVPPAQ